MSLTAQIDAALAGVMGAALPQDLTEALRELELAEDTAPVRRTLLARYLQLDANHRLDPDCQMRWLLLRGLQPVALPEDAPLLTRITRGFEPGSLGERAHGLRSAALVVLLEVDRDAAGVQAVEVLAAGGHHAETGEPALTAVRVLGACGAEHLLYAITAFDWPVVPPVARAEALGFLGDQPRARLDAMINALLESGHPVLATGVVDLALARRVEWLDERFLDLMRTTSELDLFRYGTASAVARRRGDLLARLADGSIRAGSPKEKLLAEVQAEISPG